MIDINTNGIVTNITLNRPEKRNALSHHLLTDLGEAISKVADTRVVVIRGAGPIFCSGLDLTENAHVDMGVLLADVLKALSDLPCVTVAAVHGAVMAGGTGIMGACDIVIAHPDTKFSFPEVHRGLVPALILAFLRRQIGDRKLREYLLLGQSITASEAQSVGLITRIAYNLDEEVKQVIEQALKGAPGAIKETKSFLGHVSLQNALDIHLSMRHAEEAKEGVNAFFEKRKPNWHISK